MSKTRYQLQESYESVIRKFDEIDNSMKRTEGLIKGFICLNSFSQNLKSDVFTSKCEATSLIL